MQSEMQTSGQFTIIHSTTSKLHTNAVCLYLKLLKLTKNTFCTFCMFIIAKRSDFTIIIYSKNEQETPVKFQLLWNSFPEVDCESGSIGGCELKTQTWQPR